MFRRLGIIAFMSDVPPADDIMQSRLEYDAFLSYHRPDAGSVAELESRLVAAGVRCWHDSHLPGGVEWQGRTEQAMQRSRNVVVCVGPAGLGGWQMLEVRAALSLYAESTRAQSVIPVLLPGAVPDTLPLFLKTVTWVDLRAGLDDTVAIDRLVRDIRGVHDEDQESHPIDPTWQVVGHMSSGDKPATSYPHTRE